MSKTTDMTVGSPARLILAFAFPLFLTNLGQQFYMIADASIVGRGVGVKALAAVGACDWIYWLLLWAVMGFTHGFGIFVARYFGEKNYRVMNRCIAMSAILSLGLGVFLTLAGLLSATSLLELLRTPEDIMHDAAWYLLTMISGTVAVSAYNMAGAVLRAFGNGRAPLYAMLIAGGLNIGLDLLFVIVFSWGVFGAALASVLAQLVSFLYCVLCLRQIRVVRLGRSCWQPDWKMMGDMLRFGVPVALQYVVIAISGIILQSTINAQGSIFVAGFTATNKLYGLLECSAISLGLAFATYFSQNYGARLWERVLLGVRIGLGISILLALVVTGCMMLGGQLLLQAFIEAGPGEGAEALGIAWRYLFITSSFLVILFPIQIYRNALQGMGNAIWPMLSGTSECLVRSLLGTLGVWALGRELLFYVEPAAWVGALLVLMLPYYYYRNKLLVSRNGQ